MRAAVKHCVIMTSTFMPRLKPAVTSRVMTVASVGSLIIAAFITVAVIRGMRHDWIPFRAETGVPPYAHFLVHHARTWWGSLIGSELAWSVLYVATLGVIVRLSSERGVVPLIVCSGVLLSVALFSTPLPLDSDQYAYVGYADAVNHGRNPYVLERLPANATPAERAVSAHWKNPLIRDVYGPGWTLLDAAIMSPFTHLSAWRQARIERMMAVAALWICAWALWSFLDGSAARRFALAALVLNPLVVVEIANGAHNDVMMVMFALLALVAARRERPLLAALLLGCAASMKFAYLPLVLPFAAWTFARFGLRTACAAAATSLCVFLATALPFGLAASIAQPLASVRGPGPLIAYYLWRAAYHLGARGSSEHPFTYVIPALLCVALVGASYALARRRRPEVLIACVIVGLLLMAEKLEPWYAMELVPLLAIPRPWAVSVFAGLTVAMLIPEGTILTKAYPVVLTALVAVTASVAAWLAVREPRRITLAIEA